MILLYVFLSFIILLFVFLYIITLFLNWNNFVISGVDEYENLENVYYIIIDKEFCKETNKKGLDINVYTFILFCFQNTEIYRIKIIRLFSKQFVIKD
jgi:hypothetical protein|nr:MAG: hypothetical protein [Bacteriophage sp.]